ncbi:MAG TPA: STAS domain-containing protein [Oculatellaceae cyanobacterium]
MSYFIKTFELSGNFNYKKIQQFRKEINNTLKKGTTTIILDLKNVTFMDSSGLSALVLVHKFVQAAGGKLFFCSISEPVKILFELTSMDRVFNIIENSDEFNKMFCQSSTK